MSLAIRAARTDDSATLFAIDQACFVQGIAWSKAEMLYFLKHPHNFTVVGEDETGIAGFAIAGTQRSRGALRGRLITIDVRDEQRRSGVGSALLRAVEERLRAAGVTSLILEVAVDNERALGFYARHGFARTGRIPGYYLGRIDALVMEKTLE